MNVFQLCGADATLSLQEDLLADASPATPTGPSAVLGLPSATYFFNGRNNLANNWLTIPDSLKTTILQRTDDFTLSFWIRADSSSNAAYIVSFEIGRSRYFSLLDSSPTILVLYYNRDALPGVTVPQDDGYNTQVALSFFYNTTQLPNGLRDNQWHFLAFTVNFPSVRLLVDNVEYRPTRGNYRNEFNSRIDLPQSSEPYDMPAPILTKSTDQINTIVSRIGGSNRGNQFSLFGEMRQLVISDILSEDLYVCLASCNNIIGVDPNASFPNIATSYNPVARIFDFTGTSNDVGYTDFLQSLIYYTNGFLQPEESGERRVVTLRINDELGLGNEARINLIGRSNQNDPVLDANGDLVSGLNLVVDFMEDVDREVEIFSARSFITDTDIDSVIVRVTVNLTNAQNGEFESIRLLDNPPGLVEVTDEDGNPLVAGSSSKVIFIDSIDPLRATANVFITALLSLRYINTDEEPTDIDRVIQFTVFDGIRTNDPPALTIINTITSDDVPIIDFNGSPGGVSNTVVYIEATPSLLLAENLLVSDPDSPRLTQAIARLDRVFDEGNESIAFDISELVSGLTCNPPTCNGSEITITGSASRPQYQRLLRTLRYVNLQQSIDLPSLRDRNVFGTINDGVSSSLSQASILIDFVPVNPRVIIELDAPNQNFSTSFVENQGSPILCSSIVRAVDTSIDTLESVVVFIRDVLPDGVTEDQENIRLTSIDNAGLDISFEINTALKRITFSQVASLDQYIEAIRRVQYLNDEDEPLLINRFVDFLVIPGGGAPSDTATCNITIVGINDNEPQCTPITNPIAISEGATDGHEIVRLQATDLDRGVDGELSYVLMQGDASLFEVASDTGLMTLNGDFPLDRELVDGYALVVEVCDNGEPQMCCQFNISLVVMDLNDNPPVFNSTLYELLTDENVVADFPAVFGVSDRDTGANSQLSRVEIEGNSQSGCFGRISVRLDTNNEIILSIDSPGLDFEVSPFCTFEVVAYDAGVPSLSSRATVNVTVLNVDDFPPALSMDAYTFNVEEENPFPLVIGQVEATDIDSTTLTFSEVDGMPQFDVNETTGEVIILFSSDRRIQVQYLFTVIVTDPGSRTDSAAVTVNIMAINNDPPVLDLNATDPDSLDALSPFVFIEEGSPITIATDPSISDADDLPFTVTLIRIRVANARAPNAESLSLPTGGNIPAHTLRGTASSSMLVIEPADVSSSADVYTLIQSVLYTNNEDEISECQNISFPCFYGPRSRTILFSVSDGRFQSAESAAFVTFELVNDPPQVSLNSASVGTDYTAQFTEGGDGVGVVNIASYSITDEDSDMLTALVCNLTNPVDADQDMLSLSGSLPNGLTLVSTPHMIEISGISSIASYETSLALIRYSSTSNNPDTTARRIEVYVTDDGGLSSDIAVAIITFNTVNDLPSLDLDTTSANFGFNVVYIENDPGVPLSSSPSVMDVDSTNLQRLVVTLRQGSGPEDVLSLDLRLVASPLITFSYSYPVLTVTGSTSLRIYQEIIASIRYENTADEIANVTDRIADFVITDDGNAESSLVSATISILPVDDNSPVFVPSTVYTFSVDENAPLMTPVGTIMVLDADLPPGRDEITFSIVSAEPQIGFGDFILMSVPGNPLQAQILVNGPIDYDSRSEIYGLVVMVQSSNLTRSAQSIVTITVDNLPDIPPEFNLCSEIYTVSENDDFPSPLTPSSCTAIDPDGLDPISYTIEGNAFDGTDYITIDPNNGDLSVTNRINQEIVGVSFIVTITATDSTQSTSRNATIVVQGVNEYSPVFFPALYSAAFEENAVPTGEPLVLIMATDRDEMPLMTADPGFMSRIRYSITAVSPVTPENYFSINSTSGEIFQLRSVDFESIESFTLTVEANDNDFSASPLSSLVTFAIDVNNINDEPPQFVSLSNPIIVNEVTPVREIFATIATSDPDRDASLTVSFIPPPPSQFLLSISGILSVRQELDAEVTPRIFAVTFDLSDINTDPRYPTSRTVLANTTIIIEDANDNNPVFDSNDYSGTVIENSPSGITVLRVAARDEDYGLDVNGNTNGNNMLTYSFLAFDPPPDNTFLINRLTGDITTTRPLNREDADRYVFTVMVQDNPSVIGNSVRVDTAVVTIEIQDVNEFPPIPDPSMYLAFVPESTPPSERIPTYAEVSWNTSCEYNY